MKSIKNILAIFILAVAMFSLTAISALAADGHSGGHNFETGREFGQHVSQHARAGHLGKGMNPGTHHRGFSPWAPGN